MASKSDISIFEKKTNFDDTLKKLNKNVKQKCTCSRGSKKLQTFDGAQLYLIFQPLYCTLKRLVDTEKVVSEKSKGLPPEIFTASTTTDNNLSPSVKWYENPNFC